MLISMTVFFAGAFALLIALALMILKIGNLLADCPDNGLRARPAAVTIATGFASIGGGGVVLIGALIPMVGGHHNAAVLGALGFAALCLGLGFANAVTTLRAVIADVPRPKLQPPQESPA